jgi:hypothetical protein
VIDSYGLLSVCLGRRPAASELSMPVGTEVVLSAPADDAAPDHAAPVTFTRRCDP